MSLEEQIGQLNLSVTGEIVTAQTRNSDAGKKIEQGFVGRILNRKGVIHIREMQRLAIENSLFSKKENSIVEIPEKWDFLYRYSHSIVRLPIYQRLNDIIFPQIKQQDRF